MPSRLHFAVLCGLATPACATNDGIFASDDDLVASIITTTVGGGVSTTGAVLGLDMSDGDDDFWLSDRREIEVALARGNGTWVDDVATRLALPAGLVPRLGAALQRQRPYLLGVLAPGPLTTRDWISAVGAAACCDPWLRAFAEPRIGCTPPVLMSDADAAPRPELRCAP